MTREQVLGVPVQRLLQRLPGDQPERDPVVVVEDPVVRPGHQGDEVRRQRLGLGQLPAAGGDLGGGAVAEHEPLRRRGHLHPVRRLEVGLVEAGEDPRRGVQERHRVEVDQTVGRVDTAVQALAVVGVGHRRHDDEFVLGGQAGQLEPAVGQPGHVDRLAVQRHRRQFGGFDVQEAGLTDAENTILVVEPKVWSPRVRSRSTSYEWTVSAAARVRAPSTVRLGMLALYVVANSRGRGIVKV